MTLAGLMKTHESQCSDGIQVVVNFCRGPDKHVLHCLRTKKLVLDYFLLSKSGLVVFSTF